MHITTAPAQPRVWQRSNHPTDEFPPTAARYGKFTLLSVADFAQWLIETPTYRQVRLVQNHHTLLPSYQHFNGDNHFDKLFAMEAAHLDLGLSEIAQHLTVFPDGRVALGRSLDKIPAGAKGANTFGIHVENLGNFDANQDEMAAAQRDGIVQVNALLCRKFGLTPSTDSIVYHHWFDLDSGARLNDNGNANTCPGTAFFGGNSVSAAQTHFIPLIQQALAAAEPAQPQPAQIFAGRVMADSPLNVRLQPRAWAKKIGVLHKGVIVGVFATHGAWCRVHASESRWVNGKYLERV